MGSPITFSQSDISLGRQHIAKRIMANRYCTSEDKPTDSATHADTPKNIEQPPKSTRSQAKLPALIRREPPSQPPKSVEPHPREVNTTPQNKALKPTPLTRSKPISAASKLHRNRIQHAATRRPLSPVLRAPIPDSPQTLHIHKATGPNKSPTHPTTPHPPPSGGVGAGGTVCSPARGSRSVVSGKGRETTTTNSTALDTNRVLAFGDLDLPSSPSPSGAAEYTRLHTHPG